MKASPNREQQLFLITGGVILLLILAVVIFNMVRSPMQRSADEIPKRPVVKLLQKNSNPYPNFSKMGTAPVFGKHADDNLQIENVGAREVLKPGQQPADPTTASPKHVLGGQTPDDKVLGGWNRSPSDIEAARHENSIRLAAEKRKAQAAVAKLQPSKPPEAIKVDPDSEKKWVKAPVTDFSKAIAQAVSRQQQNEQQAKQLAQQIAQQQVANKPAEPAKPVVTAKFANTPPPAPITAVPEPVVQQPSASNTPDLSNAYSVQVASLSSAERAQVLQERLRSFMFDGKRMPVYQGSAVVNSRTYYRVRLGPFTSRSKAERAERLIREKMGLQGRLIKP